jgi:hypothetical protein
MPRAEASRDEVQLVVRFYNDPSEARFLGGFVVHMPLAWLYVLHAELSWTRSIFGTGAATIS